VKPVDQRTFSEARIDWRSRIRERLAGTSPVHDREQWLVPGRTLEQTRAFIGQFPQHPRLAAVLIPLVEREEGLTVLLTQRASQLKNHAGQVAFPGGRIEPDDDGPLRAALREAQEEIGLDPSFVNVIGYLPDHVIISGFLVTPVVALVRPGFELRLDPTEVQSTFEAPLEYVFDERNYRTRKRQVGNTGVEIDVLDIPFGEHNIWGATAGMIMNLYRICTDG
jgi:8-oxo-dGTP pyrophosphatase MutT (NUDIX family)